jgi:carbon monoxide dehydrogenase subunit G
MHFSARTDIEAPIDFVFAALCDFEAWERAAMRRGADVSRTDKMRQPGVGMGWHVKFRYRGKDRDVDLRLAGLEPGTKLAFSGSGRMIAGDLSIDLVSLAPKRTRVVLYIEVKPLTIAARFFLQSLRLAKARIQAKLNARMTQFALDMETRFASTRRP